MGLVFYEGCLKEHAINYPDWAPESLVEKRDDLLNAWMLQAQKHHFKPLPVAQNVTQLFDHLLTEPEMESVWNKLLKRADSLQVQNYPEQLLNEIFKSLILEDSFLDSMPKAKRNTELEAMIKHAMKLQQIVRNLNFDFALKPIYRKRMKSSRVNSKFYFEEIVFSDLFDEIYNLAEKFSGVPGYLNKTNADHDIRRCEIFIKFMHLHFKEVFDLFLDEVLIQLVRVIFNFTFPLETMRGKRQRDFDPNRSPSEKRQGWPP